MSTLEAAREEHRRALKAAFSIFEAEALARMRGEFPKRFDSRGIHPASEEWGRIHALEALHPELAVGRGADADPVSMRHKAEGAARRRFAEQLLAEHAVPVE